MSLEAVMPEIGKNSSVIVFGAHPDDAVRACGGVVLRTIRAGGRLAVVKATDGAALYGPEGVPKGRETGPARRNEELQALRILGVPRSSLFLLGFPDGGLEALRNSYYPAEGLPYYDPWLASDRVDDAECFRNGRPFFGESLARTLGEIVERCRPTHVFTHCSRDRHPDHRALTFFVRKAVTELLLANRLECVPVIHEYLTYHTRVKWPSNPGRAIDAGKAAELHLPGSVVSFELTAEEEKMKNRAQEEFVPILGRAYMDPWMRSNEIYWRTGLFEGARS